MTSTTRSRALEKGAAGERLEPGEAYALVEDLSPDGLHDLGAAALENRQEILE